MAEIDRFTSNQKRELVHLALERGLFGPEYRWPDFGGNYTFTDSRSGLTSREAHILNLRFPIGKPVVSQTEVGVELAVTGADIGIFERRALGKLQRLLQ